MSTVLIAKLIAISTVVALGWGAGRTRLLGGEASLRTLSNLAFYVLTPALLFRTTARIDLGAQPWGILLAYFGPVVALLLTVYTWQRLRQTRRGTDPNDTDPAAPSVRAVTTTFGNTVQLGIPIVTALFGEAGLTLHVAIVSVHGMALLTILTVLAETDTARAAARAIGDGPAGRPSMLATVAVTARRTVVHPIVLPVLAGLVWNLVGLPVSGPLDEVLSVLAQGVVPVCLVLIGVSLAHHGVAGVAWGVLALSAGKLVVQPAAVLVAAHWGAGLSGTPLAVVVLCAALPIGSNALLFAQRYASLESETTAALVASTLAFAATGPAWLILLTRFFS